MSFSEGRWVLNVTAIRFDESSYTSDALAAAAHNSSGQLANFSNHGVNSADISAPGVSILSSVPGTGYSSFKGSSMVAPHAAGVTALVLGSDPSMSSTEAISVLMEGGWPSPGICISHVLSKLRPNRPPRTMQSTITRQRSFPYRSPLR
ncbi:S8 family serine peptidase [Acidimicrobiales bacterium]|jgi:subtilisin family serine protease|nr:S8 family serine peptidase [Acidimicrobiales bacterium]